MTEEDRDALWTGLTVLPSDVQERIGQLMEKGKSAEEIAAAIMVGPCPGCGSEHTRDDDDVRVLGLDPGDTTVGVCLDCGYLWCLDCGEALPKWPCPHWDRWSEYCKANGLDEEEANIHEWLEKERR